MTITITKAKLAIAIAAVALLVPATAIATHSFSDVPDGQYYTDAVEWAAANGITTGYGDGTFRPDEGVTRGQNVTFAHRYDQNIVQPALTTLTTNVGTNASDIAALPRLLTISVDDDGTKLQGDTGITSSQTSTGDYIVDFGEDIDGCTWTSSIRWDAALIVTGDGMITLNSVYNFNGFSFVIDPQEIWVQTFSDNDTEADIPFDLLVVC